MYRAVRMYRCMSASMYDVSVDVCSYAGLSSYACCSYVGYYICSLAYVAYCLRASTYMDACLHVSMYENIHLLLYLATCALV